MVDRAGAALAARLKARMDAQEHHRKANDARAEARRAAMGRARAALLQDLARFGLALGHVAVQIRSDGVVFRHQSRVLRFEPMGEGDVVRVRGTGLMTGLHRLVLADSGAWALATHDRDHRERYRPLFDQGLEELLTWVLHIPEAPKAEPAPPRNWIMSPARPPA